jgi:hypothetical protein
MRSFALFAKKLVGGSMTIAYPSSSSTSNYSSNSRGSNHDSSRIREIDLRNNFISLDGVRIVATGLENLLTSAKNSSSSASAQSRCTIKSVVVKDGGRIECFADDEKGQNVNAGGPELVVDMTCNFDADELVTEARRFNRRRGRGEWDEAGAATSKAFGINGGSNNNVGSNSSMRDSQLHDIYGEDLVSTLLRDDVSKRDCIVRRKVPSSLLEKQKQVIQPPVQPLSPIPGGEIPSLAIAKNSSTRTRLNSPFASEGSMVVSRLSVSASLPKLSGS